MPDLFMSTLGMFQVQRNGAAVNGFESDKVRALLVYLAVECARPHRRSALAGLLWPEREERAALLNLNQALVNLRRVIADCDTDVPLLHVARDTIQLNPAGLALDLASFTNLLDACEAHMHRDPADCAACAERLQQAVAMYRGAFLEGFAPRDSRGFQEWALSVRERVQHRMLRALGQLAAYHDRCGATEAALQAVYRQIELDPWREEAHRAAMRLLWHHGQRAAALAQYERCRAVLDAELGLEPNAETTALYEQIRVSSGSAEPAGETRAQQEPPPAAAGEEPLTPFLGREAELAQLADHLGNPACRLVTIVGLGGSGKTRLAIQAAAAQRSSFAEGACFVPLAAAGSESAIIPMIAQKLGLTLGAAEDPIEQLASQIREHRLLLVLDNLEQLQGAADVVGGLLARIPGLTVLATSRERLGLRGEWVLELSGLHVPEDAGEDEIASSSASALFLQVARRARYDFAPDAAERRALVRICRALAGHPLGIELAAGWVHMLSCAEIEQELHSSMELLASTAHDLPERHRTIRAIFDSTWRLLSDDEREVLRRLAVFRGGFDRAAASHVAGASLARLAGLLNRSLLIRAAEGRFDMHEFVRQYALEQLRAANEAGEIAGRHLAHFHDLVEQADPHMKTANEAAWMDRLEREHDNLRGALDHALEHGGVATAARMCEILRWFWYIRGHMNEGYEWVERSLKALDMQQVAIAPATRGKLYHAAGIFADERGDYRHSAARYGQALALYREQGDTKGVQVIMNSLGMLAAARGEYAEAQACYEETIRLSRILQHNWGVANGLNNLGDTLNAQGKTAEALAAYQEALPLAQATGYEQLVTVVLDNIGEAALAQGDQARAQRSFREALVIQRTNGDIRGEALSLQGLGLVALAEHEYDQAAQHLYAALRHTRQSGSRREFAKNTDTVAALLVAQGQPALAVRLCAATTALRTRIGTPLTPYEHAMFDRTVEGARAALGTIEFATLWAEGAAASLDQLVGDLLAAPAAVA